MKGTVANLLSAVLLGLCLTAPAARADIIYATTGSGIEEFNSSGGTGSVFAAGGWGVLAVNSSGTLYAAGPDNTLYKFDSSGNASLFANTGLDFPGGLAFDAKGNIYVSNVANNTIEEFNPSGTGSVFATAASGLDFPGGLAFDASGNLYVANYNNTILKFNTNGVASVFTTAGLNNPGGLAFGSNGNLYVVNSSNIETFNPSGGGSIFTSTNLLSSPIDLGFDSSGNLYVTSHGTASILEFNPDGVGSVFASGLGNAVNLAIDEIPEPSSLLLLGLAAVSLAPFLRRKRA